MGSGTRNGFKMFTLRMIPAIVLANARIVQSLKNAETTFHVLSNGFGNFY